MFHWRQKGHCGSSNTVSVTGALAFPSVSPCCETPVNVETASAPPPDDAVVPVVVDDEPEPPPATTITTTTTTTAAASAAPSTSRRFLGTATESPNGTAAPPCNT